jgi:glutamyl-tRNA synthetase
MVEWFDLDAIGKSAARFDFAKLENLNGHYIRHMADDKLLMAFVDFLPHAEGGKAMKARIDDAMMAKLLRALPGLKERAKTLVELKNGAQFLFAERPLAMDDKAQQIIKDGGAPVLAGVISVLEQIANWQAHDIETAVKLYAEAKGLKLGKVAQPLRAALTGTSTSPGIFDVLDVLGRDESLARLRDQASS